jgi:hypothetical protein
LSGASRAQRRQQADNAGRADAAVQRALVTEMYREYSTRYDVDAAGKFSCFSLVLQARPGRASERSSFVLRREPDVL